MFLTGEVETHVPCSVRLMDAMLRDEANADAGLAPSRGAA
jgi:hypothetical protein